MTEIVKTDRPYTYEVLKSDLDKLVLEYPFLKVSSIGKSVLGKDLFCIRLGSGNHHVFYNASHHGLEWITSNLLMKFTENFCMAYRNKDCLRGYDIEKIWNVCSIFIVPMVNPDGVNLVLNGLKDIDECTSRNLIEWNGSSDSFACKWQSNANGVDLNHNYDASWSDYRDIEIENDTYRPSHTRHSGPFPESEPESRAVANFTRKNNFQLVIAYHSQGEEIFWNYNNMAPDISRKIVEEFSKVSGYEVSEPEGLASFSGYKDWFIKEYQRPGFTIEVGSGINPLPISQFDKIYSDNEELLILASFINF